MHARAKVRVDAAACFAEGGKAHCQVLNEMLSAYPADVTRSDIQLGAESADARSTRTPRCVLRLAHAVEERAAAAAALLNCLHVGAVAVAPVDAQACDWVEHSGPEACTEEAAGLVSTNAAVCAVDESHPGAKGCARNRQVRVLAVRIPPRNALT
mmetsp:Transcript_24213/g.67975  ORF Transcript_24213/g.67975 Transcript_24213/m.67975 type:complete len:155 (-) Transcript_24213:166-630(-)